MIIIHMNNGDVVKMPRATYQSDGNFYTDSTMKIWVGTLKNNNFVSADIQNNVITKSREFSIVNTIARLRGREQFGIHENEQLMNLKKLLTGYRPLSGKYK